MIKRDELITFIKKTIGYELLEKARNKDDMANGVQILGGSNVEVVTLGVSLNEEFLIKVVADRSNFCIFHHGFDFRTYKSRLSPDQMKRLKIIFQNNITVMGFHYAHDAHEEIGNNAQIIKQLGATIKEPLFEEWGYTATFHKPVSVKELKKRCRELFNREIYFIESDREMIRTIGVVSGGAAPYAMHIQEMIDKDVEVYISGETKESAPHKLKEAGIAYFICGHYTTEVFGVKALGEALKKHFKDRLVVEFIDVPNPI